MPEVSENLSGTNFETKDKRSCGRHTWQWLVEGQTLGPSLAWLRISSHLLSKSFRYLQPYYPPSNFLVFSPNRFPPPPNFPLSHGMGIKQPGEDICFDKAKWCLLQISEVTLKEIKNTEYFDILFFLSFSHIHIYIYTRIHFCCSKVMLWHWICPPLGNGP